MPNCLGAIDGKHIAIQCPYKSGSKFYNYKHFYSIILMAICDADYKFTFVDIGAQGKVLSALFSVALSIVHYITVSGMSGDSGVFKNSDFGAAILNMKIDTPDSKNLPSSNKPLPHFFVADEAFPLRKNIMRPYPRKNATKEQLVFNYRLSRARRTIENSFGILASRWRILRRPIIGHPKTVDAIVKATTVLHNFLRTLRQDDPFIRYTADIENNYGEVGYVLNGLFFMPAITDR